MTPFVNSTNIRTHFAVGSLTHEVTLDDARELLCGMLDALRPMKRVLIVPPDATRSHAWAGELTCLLWEMLRNESHVEILPALGTHVPMTATQITRMYPGIPLERFLIHDWRNALTHLGDVPGEFVSQVSGGRVDTPIRCEISSIVAEGNWDRIISVGQLVPHEVIGIANHSKNIFIGTGGKDIIDRSHFLGAACGMESIMGRAQTPVRQVIDRMATEFASHLPITYLLTVRARSADGRLVTRGLYAGEGNDCFNLGASLVTQVNLDLLPEPLERAVVFLDPEEFHSTWLGNKAVYRLRMAMADDGEIIIIAPGVKTFGEDPGIDKLIRQHGYRGTAATLRAVKDHSELATSLSAAAHLIHGASEGRFRITWCPGALSREEIESVGYDWRDPAEAAAAYDITTARDGWNVDARGERFFYVSNPALGLWALQSQFKTPNEDLKP